LVHVWLAGVAAHDRVGFAEVVQAFVERLGGQAFNVFDYQQD